MMSKDSSLTIRILTFLQNTFELRIELFLSKDWIKNYGTFPETHWKTEIFVVKNDANSLDKVWTNHLHSELLCETETYD